MKCLVKTSKKIERGKKRDPDNVKRMNGNKKMLPPKFMDLKLKKFQFFSFYAKALLSSE